MADYNYCVGGERMLRMEIALIIILGFIAYMYYSAERKHTKLHRTFSVLRWIVIVHLVFDAVTIYTVNIWSRCQSQ